MPTSSTALTNDCTPITTITTVVCILAVSGCASAESDYVSTKMHFHISFPSIGEHSHKSSIFVQQLYTCNAINFFERWVTERILVSHIFCCSRKFFWAYFQFHALNNKNIIFWTQSLEQTILHVLASCCCYTAWCKQEPSSIRCINDTIGWCQPNKSYVKVKTTWNWVAFI